MGSGDEGTAKKKPKAPLTMARTVELLNRSFEKGSNPSISRLATSSFGGRINAFDEAAKTMSMQFRLTEDMCPDQLHTQVLEAFAGACLDVSCSQYIINCCLCWVDLQNDLQKNYMDEGQLDMPRV